MTNFNSSPNTMASGDNGGVGPTNSQSRPRPVIQSTPVSGTNSTALLSNQFDAYIPSHFQNISVDLTNLNDSVDTNDTMRAMTVPYVSHNLGMPLTGGLGDMTEQSLSLNIRNILPNLDPETPDPNTFGVSHGVPIPHVHQTLDMAPIANFISQALEPASNSNSTNTGMDPYHRQHLPQENTAALPATPAPARQPSRGVTEAPEPQIEHVPPNRITEAGPIPHPDPEWRPYGTNHWHVFISSHETLKYLSTSEVKEIRDHCYQLSKGTDEDGNPTGEALPIPDTAYTTADAQTVWKYCDAYIRRRGQLRNNNAARRSRQKKEAEMRYWKQKALEYGCPDHDFVWDEREVTSPPSSNAYASTPQAAATAVAQTRARHRQRRSPRARGQRRAGTAVAAARGGPGSAPDVVLHVASEAVHDFNQPLTQDNGTGYSAAFGTFAGYT